MPSGNRAWILMPPASPRKSQVYWLDEDNVMRFLSFCAGTICILSACSQPDISEIPSGIDDSVAQAASQITPLVTLQDLMINEIDASADAIWDASGSTTTARGIEIREPKNDAEWAALRRHAVVLLEATNLLLIPGRKVAALPFPSDGPGVLSSDEIQQHIDTNREQFNALALGLRAVAQQELAAIDARDTSGLLQLGDAMDTACEACHRVSWYPAEAVPDTPENPPSISDYQ
ncbi:MAG: hypothetical protein QM581_02515 [Pseudomonas sp.]